jgi:predicted  nucleic acid-binding Zn-ribbon protein
VNDLERVLAVQVVDSALGQLPHRSDRLDERAITKRLAAAIATTMATIEAASARIAEAEARIAELEAAGTARATKKARLEQQLKTIISPRQAEALMSEIATLDHDRSVADDEELELLDAVERSEATSTEAQGELDQLRAEAAVATAELEAAEAVLAAERADLVERRAALTAEIPGATLERYERMRKSFGGVAISRLHGDRCGACHLDQSRAALEALRHAPDDAETECEQCGRLLVR